VPAKLAAQNSVLVKSVLQLLPGKSGIHVGMQFKWGSDNLCLANRGLSQAKSEQVIRICRVMF
jgi:hypothetical protein